VLISRNVESRCGVGCLLGSADFETEDGGESDGTGNAALWREEIRKRYEQESQFIAELRARNLGNGQEFEEKVC
jgi:hypothetical protein